MRADLRSRRRALIAVVGASLACGDPGPAPVSLTGTNGQQITIRNYEFLPRSLTVIAGSTVLVRNEDPFVHSVTSETAPGLYTASAVQGVSFDTGPFTGTRAIAIPATAAPGTVLPYFCTIHGAAMVNEGELVVAP